MAEHQNKMHQNLIDRSDCVIVVVDVQEKLMPVISGKEEVASNVVKLCRFSGICGIPVIVTEQQKLGPTLGDVKDSINDFTSIEKVHFNCFYNSEFKDRVERSGRKTLVIAGVESHICVAQTAVYALHGGYNVHVIGDAVSSRSRENKEIAIARMRYAGAVISSTEMFIYEMLVKAGSEEFKAVLPLVK